MRTSSLIKVSDYIIKVTDYITKVLDYINKDFDYRLPAHVAAIVGARRCDCWRTSLRLLAPSPALNWVRRRLACIPSAAYAPWERGRPRPHLIAAIAAKSSRQALAHCAGKGFLQARRLRTIPSLLTQRLVRARRPRSQGGYADDGCRRDVCVPRQGRRLCTINK